MIREQRPNKFRSLRSLTRLLVGGILLGSDTLVEQMRAWEGLPDDSNSLASEGESQSASQEEPLPETLPPPQVGLPVQSNPSDVRYALIGLIFEGEETLEKMLSAAKRVGDRALRITDPLFLPFQKFGQIFPPPKRFNRLIDRGQSEVESWVTRGQNEEKRSRELVQKATTSTVDQSITYMAHNPALEELIQTQSVSLAQQILELVRSDAVSADYFFEDLVRYALRRKPRYLLPPPTPDVQAQATWTLKDIRHEGLNDNE
jgi:hypothetical protein